MSSINTNYSAIAALKTLRSLTSELQTAQNRVSTGLRVEKSADNAAYWSIATTMRSDNRALSAVSDAIGLGEALVETHTSALDSVVDILGEIKAKLIAATEKGVDKAKIQAEIEGLKGALTATAASTSFSGENWLNTDIADLGSVTHSYKNIASSFVRGADNSVHIDTTEVDLTRISLFNSTGSGLLQADMRSLGLIGGLRNADFSATGATGYVVYAFASLPDPDDAALTASDQVSFDITVDGGVTRTVTIDKNLIDTTLGRSSGLINNSGELTAVIQSALSNMGWNPGPITYNSTYIAFASAEFPGMTESSVSISNVTSTLVGGYAFGLGGPPASKLDGGAASYSFAFPEPFFVHRDVAFSFDVSVDGGATKTLTIDRSIVDSALGTTTGTISSAADYAKVLNAVLDGTGLNATANGANVVLTVDLALNPEKGGRSSLRLNNVAHNIGYTPDFNIIDIDITDPAKSLDNYISGVDMMFRKAVSAASYLGSINRMIETQDNFVNTLQDTVTKGIGRLIDADMEEESSRLAALQTQQQLALQSLWIANGAPQNVLRLFQ
ncbi:flagellin N-terminal helical domain-containing protein [Rhizobium binxianense]